jgi:hypothetical protein
MKASISLFKKPQNRSKCLTLLKKASHHFKKASLLLNMLFNNLAIFEKASLSSEKPQFL